MELEGAEAVQSVRRQVTAGKRSGEQDADRTAAARPTVPERKAWHLWAEAQAGRENGRAAQAWASGTEGRVISEVPGCCL